MNLARAILTCLLLGPPALGQGTLGTGFTYQGRLDADAVPLNGTADFQFSLYDAPTLGTLLAGPVTVASITVADGLFTAQVDFGAAAFNGDARWLQIAVRAPAGGGPYTPLSPRQPVTPAPYALYALYGPGFALPYLGSVSSAATAFSVTNTGTGGTGYFQSAGGTATLFARSTGTAEAGAFEITNPSNSNPAVLAVTSGGGQALYAYTTGSGMAGSFQVAGAANSSASLQATTNGSGNAGRFQVNASGNSADCVFSRTFGSGRAGYFDISNAANINPALEAVTNGSGPAVRAYTSGAIAGHFEVASGNGWPVYGVTLGSEAAGRFVVNNASNDRPAVDAISYGVGNVGFFWARNNANPTAAVYGLMEGGGSAVKGWASAASGATYAGWFQNDSVSGTAVSANASAAGGTTYGVYGRSGSGLGYGGYFTSPGIGVRGISTTSGAGILAESSTGYGLYATSGTNLAAFFDGDVQLVGPDSFNANGEQASLLIGDANHTIRGVYGQGLRLGVFGAANAIAIAEPSGHVGIGTVNPQARLHVEGGDLMLESTATVGRYISNAYDLLFSKDPDGNNSDAWYRFYTDYSIEQLRITDGDEAAVLADGAVYSNGLDFAEAFEVGESDLEPGDVVSLGNGDWQRCRRSVSALDPYAIGVVSARPSFVCGMSFSAEDAADADLAAQRDQARAARRQALAAGDTATAESAAQTEKALTLQLRELVARTHRPIAMLGRVPVKVVGIVRSGDFLTSSDTPGHAIRLSTPGPALGIALQDKPDAAPGMVLALVQPGWREPRAGSSAGTPDPAERSELAALRRQLHDQQLRVARLEATLAAGRDQR